MLGHARLATIHLFALPLATLMVTPVEVLDAKAADFLTNRRCHECAERKLPLGQDGACRARCQEGLCPRIRTVYPPD